MYYYATGTMQNAIVIILRFINFSLDLLENCAKILIMKITNPFYHYAMIWEIQPKDLIYDKKNPICMNTAYKVFDPEAKFNIKSRQKLLKFFKITPQEYEEWDK